MKTIICDRCNKVVAANEVTTTHCLTVQPRSSVTGVDNTQAICCDLCNDCFLELAQWLGLFKGKEEQTDE